MNCHEGLDEHELLLAVLLPVCMVAVIIVAVAIYCVVMSSSLCPGRRDRALSVETAVAEALAKERRARERRKARIAAHPHPHYPQDTSNKKYISASQHRRITARRGMRNSDGAPNNAIGNSMHEKIGASSLGRSEKKRFDGEQDGAPGDAASASASSDGRPTMETGAKSNKSAIANDVVHTESVDPHDGESQSSSKSDV